MTRKGCIFILIVVVAAWFGVTHFWFHNVDLSYLHQYIDIVNPIGKFDGVKIIRGHVLLHLPIYLIFGHAPAPYYLTALILHAVVAVIVGHIVYAHHHNTRIAILTSLFFGINMAYVNVLFEGAFNLYYPFLAILFLLAYIAVMRQSLALLALVTLVGFTVRETTLIMPIIVLFSICMVTPRKQWRIGIIRYTIPIIVLCLGYLFIRASFLGNLKSDLTDDAVQFRYALLSSGRYGEYVTTVVTNAFRMFAEQVIPPYVLYSANPLLSRWYVTVMGVSFVIVMVSLLYRSFQRHEKGSVSLMLFGLGWMTVFNLFISMVLPFPRHVIEQGYTVDSVLSRYNYYGFIGLAFFLSGLLMSIKKRNIAIIIVVLTIVANAVSIQDAQSRLYTLKHAKAKDFYATVFESYPTLPPRVVIYYNFFQVNDLKDYIGDYVWIFAKTKYPTTQFILETTASHVQEEYKKGNYKKEELYAFDLDDNGYVRDFSATFRNSIESTSQAITDFRYPIELYANKSTDIKLTGTIISSAETCPHELSDYWKASQSFTSDASITTSSQYGDYPRFSFIHPHNLIDNQFSNDFYWQADVVDQEPTITLNLGSIQEVNTFAWEGEPRGNNIPRDYTLSVSQDGITWTPVHSVTKNTKSSRIDSFSSQTAQYVRVNISTTSLGQPVKFTEIRVFNLPADFSRSWESLHEVEEHLVTSGCVFSSQNSHKNILVRIVSTTDEGSTKAYNQLLTVGWGVYTIPVVHLEMRSNTRSIFKEKLDHFVIETGPYTQSIWEKILISQ